MASLDEIFYREFNQMMFQLKGSSGYINLEDIELPPACAGRFFIENRSRVFIGNIVEEYYNQLAGTEALLWGSSALRRRKFDYQGKFMKDKNGNYILQDVPCPHDAVAIISDLSIGVPNKFKSKESFQYVDMITKTLSDGGKLHKFVYIVPKKYCYKMNMTALVLSWNKLRSFYSGVGLALTNGHILYLYIIPYKPTAQTHNYRILHCKTSSDYSEEIQLLKDFWVSRGIMFNPDACQLYDYVKGRENMAVIGLDSVLDNYERYDITKSLGHEETFDDIEFEGED